MKRVQISIYHDYKKHLMKVLCSNWIRIKLIADLIGLFMDVLQTKEFDGKRSMIPWLKQGDSVSPFLFLIVTSYLSRMPLTGMEDE